MDEQLKEKSLKLLADPNKLKDYNRPSGKKLESLQLEIESYYQYKLSKKLYNDIKDSITREILVHKVVSQIIEQVIENQNLKIVEYSLI